MKGFPEETTVTLLKGDHSSRRPSPLLPLQDSTPSLNTGAFGTDVESRLVWHLPPFNQSDGRDGNRTTHWNPSGTRQRPEPKPFLSVFCFQGSKSSVQFLDTEKSPSPFPSRHRLGEQGRAGNLSTRISFRPMWGCRGRLCVNRRRAVTCVSAGRSLLPSVFLCELFRFLYSDRTGARSSYDLREHQKQRTYRIVSHWLTHGLGRVCPWATGAERSFMMKSRVQAPGIRGLCRLF